MAKKSVYIPFYHEGAYHYLEVTGTYSADQVPEGEPSLKSSACSTTPPKRLQPHPKQESRP